MRTHGLIIFSYENQEKFRVDSCPVTLVLQPQQHRTQTSYSIHAQSHFMIYEDVNCPHAAGLRGITVCHFFFHDFVLTRVNLEQMLATTLPKRSIMLDLS